MEIPILKVHQKATASLLPRKAEIECGEAGDLGCAPTAPHLDTGRVKPPASSARHRPAPPPAGSGGSAPIMLPALGWDRDQSDAGTRTSHPREVAQRQGRAAVRCGRFECDKDVGR